MQLSSQIARHIREVHFGGNWTDVNLKNLLSNVTWQQATTPLHSCNTIAALVFHVNFFVRAVLKVLRGGPLDAHDKYSFDLPPITSQADWEDFLQQVWSDAEDLAQIVETLPEDRLWQDFDDGKYGTIYRNLTGIIEHTHYHLGQIALLKKIIAKQGSS
jgi:hypothetical protein